MKIKELIEESEFTEVRNEVNIFVKDMLSDYLKDLYIAEDKQIFDFVWGPVEFNLINKSPTSMLLMHKWWVRGTYCVRRGTSPV